MACDDKESYGGPSSCVWWVASRVVLCDLCTQASVLTGSLVYRLHRVIKSPSFFKRPQRTHVYDVSNV